MTTRTALLPGCFAACLALPLHAAAEPEVMVVTALRIPQPIHDVSGALSVIELDAERDGDRMLGDVLRRIPGLALSQSGGFGQLTELRMRGGEANHTLVLLDGLELTNPTTGRVDFAHLTTAGIERVEVLRGAQSALWGSHAVAGVINLVSRKGGRPSLSVRAGSDNRLQTTGRLAASAAHGSMHATFQHFRTRGDNLAMHGGEDDGYRNRTLHWSTRWTPTPDADLRVSLRQTRARTEYDRYEYAGDAPGLRDAPFKADSRRTYLHAALHAETGSLRHQWGIRYLQTRDHYHDDFPAHEVGHRIQLEALAWRPFEACLAGWPCTLGGGLEWTRERYARNTIGPLRFITSSAMGTLKLQPTPRLSLDLSLRRDRNRDFGNANTWRTAVGYRWPGRPLRLYAAYGIGIANPTLTERYGYFPNTFIGNPDLIPERSRSREFGFEYRPGGRCCSLGVHAFTQRLTDEIQTLYAEQTAINRPGTSRRRGMELELGFAPTERWTLRGHYAYLHATEPSADGNTPEARRPRHQYRLAAAYQAANWRLQLDASTVRGLRDAGKALENHEQVRLSVRYAPAPRLQLMLDIRNLLDQSYQEVKNYPAPDRSLTVGLTWRFD